MNSRPRSAKKKSGVTALVVVLSLTTKHSSASVGSVEFLREDQKFTSPKLFLRAENETCARRSNYAARRGETGSAHGTYQKLRAALKAQGIVLSRNQVRYRCKLLGVVGRVRPKCPTTDPAKLKRIRAFARKWRPWAADPANVRKLIVCDEWPGATHDASDRTQLTLPGSKPVPRRRRKRYADHSVQAWVCFGWNFRKIVFSDSRTSRHNSRTYREDCLRPVLRELKLGWFYQDGARCHWGNTSKKTDPEGPMELSNRSRSA